jgi:uncharacterized membrane protein YfcA
LHPAPDLSPSNLPRPDVTPTDLTGTAIPPAAYALALFGVFCLGLSKTGFPGLSMVNVAILAEVFGAKASVGIALPLLILADFIVYPAFRKFASWRETLPLLVPAAAGVLAGWQLLGRIDDLTARRIIGTIVLAMLALQLLRQYRAGFIHHLPDSRAFRWGTGGAIGVSTTLANAAGPVYGVYAIVHKMPKETFLGVGARLFLAVNLLKLPFNADLGILNSTSLRINLALVPALLAGLAIGRYAITRVPQKLFDALLLAFTAAAGVRLAFF